MKLGITSLIYHQRGFWHCLKDIAEIGYEYVELNCVRGYYCHFDALQLLDSPQLLEMIKHGLQDYGLKCSAVDCHGLYQGPRSAIPYSERYVEATIDIAVALGAPMVITSYPNGDASWGERVTGTRRLAMLARSKGIGFAVEAEGGFVISNSRTMRKFIDDVGDGLIKVNYDPTHYIVAGEDPVEALTALKPDLAHVHLKDFINGHADAYREANGSPADCVLQTLKEWKYDGVVSAETLADICDQPEIMSRQIMAAVRKRLSM